MITPIHLAIVISVSQQSYVIIYILLVKYFSINYKFFYMISSSKQDLGLKNVISVSQHVIMYILQMKYSYIDYKILYMISKGKQDLGLKNMHL